MPNPLIPFHRPSIGAEEFKAVNEVLASGWLTTGPVCHRFEAEFAAYLGCKYALAVNSCTAALQLALDAAGIGSGDEVLLPSYTFTATAEVVTYFGAIPVLCDSVKGGFNIDPESVEAHITPRTRAIIAVHIAGEACDLTALRAIATKYGLHLIEDAAHALPGRYGEETIGSSSELAAFSFYATKTITTGEGGMLVTNNPEYARRASIMRLHGISGDAWKRYSSEGDWYYEVVEHGYKLNMPDLLAALGLAQLGKADQFHHRRCEIAGRYIEAFGDVDEIELPAASALAAHSWHLFILRLRAECLSISRADFIRALKAAGIGVSVHFIPLHLHPIFRERYGYARGDFPHAEDAYDRALSIPIYPDMTPEEVDRVIAAVQQIVVAHRKTQLVTAA